jgi:hypothetical protein
MNKVFGWLMIELPEAKQVDFNKAIHSDNYGIENIRSMVKHYNEYNMSSTGNSLQENPIHDLGVVHSLLTQLGFKEEVGFTVNNTKRFLYVFKGRDIGIVKMLYGVYSEMDKLPIKFYGIGFESTVFLEYTNLAYCNKLGQRLKMDMVAAEYQNDNHVRAIREIYEKLPIKEKAMMTMSYSEMSTLFHKIEYFLNKNMKETDD